MQDPTHEEMIEWLKQVPETDDFDIEEAIYWFANDYHGGQCSNLYSALSTSPFNTGPLANGPEENSMADILYCELECEYTEER